MWGQRVDGDQVVAYLIAIEVDDDIHIDQVSVRTEFEGAGIGAALIDLAATWGRALAHVGPPFSPSKGSPGMRPTTGVSDSLRSMIQRWARNYFRSSMPNVQPTFIIGSGSRWLDHLPTIGCSMLKAPLRFKQMNADDLVLIRHGLKD